MDYFLDRKKKIIISTGMMSFSNIKELTRHIKYKLGTKTMTKKIALLHCVTSYPALDEDLNLNSIPFLIKNQNLLLDIQIIVLVMRLASQR